LFFLFSDNIVIRKMVSRSQHSSFHARTAGVRQPYLSAFTYEFFALQRRDASLSPNLYWGLALYGDGAKRYFDGIVNVAGMV
jgi:hypothetical protein